MERKKASILGCMFLLGCATSPTGRSQLLLLPESQMAELGTQAFTEMKASEPVSTASAPNRYVSCISDAILSAAGLTKEQQWEVVVFQSNQINAFALPGGKIGVYTGMIEFAENQHQLAAVVGHEVGHVIAQHGNERVSQQTAAAGFTQLLAAVTNANESQTGQMVMAGLGLGFQYGVALPFGRTQEEESDVIGLKMMAKAGFDPSEAPKLWVKMDQLGGGGGPEFLSTHPDPSRRAEYLRRMQKDVAPSYQQARANGRRPNCQRP
ncbi:MAG: M48 family metallopeptidase [Myxococcota bacterium]